MNRPLWRSSLVEIVTLLESGACTSTELVASFAQRISETEPLVHAWAHLDIEGAMLAARQSDERREDGRSLGPIDGIPLGVKDVIHVMGMPTAGGSRALEGAANSPIDSAAVARWRAGGGILLGKTRTYEFAIGQGNPGTLNPRAPGRYAGGSSIGSGVAVAVGAVPAALGTDTGGSIRNPAAVNGLVGVKPSAGLVPTSGSLRISSTLDAIGPLAGSVLGCAYALEAIAPTKPGDPKLNGFVNEVLHYASNRPRRIGIDRQLWQAWGIDASIMRILESTLEHLAREGTEIVELHTPEWDLAFSAGLAISLSEAAREHRELLRNRAQHYDPGSRSMIAVGALIDAHDIELSRRFASWLAAHLGRQLQANRLDAIATPTLPSPAPLLAQMSSELTSGRGQNALGSALRILSAANLTGLPALSLPCGETAGLPVGLHLLGSSSGDSRLLGFALTVEQSLGLEFTPIDPVAVAL